MKNYEQEFKKFLFEVKGLGYGTVSSYISTITSYLDNLMAKIDTEHTSILHTVDTELLELYYLDLKENKNSKNINLKRHNNALSTLNTYIKFSKYYSRNIYQMQDKEENNNQTNTSSIIKIDEEEQLDKNKNRFIKYAKENGLSDLTIYHYCNTITKHIDNYIRKHIDKTHYSIFTTIDNIKLNSWYNILLNKYEYNEHNAKTHNTISSAFKKYIEFAEFYRNCYKSSYIETPNLEETVTISEKNKLKQSDNTPNLEDIEKEIATLTKWSLPIPKELLEAKEIAKEKEKKKKQRLLKNNIEYSLNNILTQIPISMKYNISYTKEDGFIINFLE